MLSFLKSKPVLKDLLSDHYVDIHSHLIPGIDDGAKTITDTRKLISAFEQIGISHIITTPHISHYIWNNTSEIITARHQETKLLLDESNIKIPFEAAAEYFIDDWFEAHFKTEKLLTSKGILILLSSSRSFVS